LTSTVIDASVALAWCFSDETSAYADAVLVALEHQQILVPAVWPLEITNALAVAERRKRIHQPEILRFVELLDGLRIRQDSLSVSGSIVEILPLARMYGLSAYDAAYLEVALRHRASLATLDDGLDKACRAEGIEILMRRRPPKAKR